MHSPSKNKYILSLFIVLIALSQLSQKSFAKYEVIKAKTVGNGNIIEQKSNEEAATFNDMLLPSEVNENSTETVLEKKIKKVLSKKSKKEEVNETITNEEIISKDETYQEYKVRTEESIDEKNKFQINADKITYNDEEGNIYAKGNVEIISKEKGVKLIADDAVLEKQSQTIKLYNNVKIIKDGIEMSGEYMLVDLNEQNILMDNPTVEAYSFDIVAQEGYLIANDIQLINGTIKNNKATVQQYESRGFYAYDNIIQDCFSYKTVDRTQDLKENSNKQVYRIDAKEIKINSYKTHNSMVMKHANVYYNNHKILFNTDIEIVSDKERQVVDMSAPEGGSLRGFGTYIGYGVVNKLPNGQTLKLMPSLVFSNSKVGVGIIGRHKSQNSQIDAGWATSSNNLVVRGKYRLTKDLVFRYGRNAYLSEGFMGARRSGYAAQLEYQKGYTIKDLGNAHFEHGIYAGYFSDYKKHDLEHAYSTSRFRYSAQLHKEIFKFVNEEEDLSISLSALAQAAATLYGSGHTQGVARFGPIISTKVKWWESNIGYMFGGFHDDSPFEFDKYRYGRSAIMINEKINIANKFAFGYRAYINPLKDNYEDKLITESRFYTIFGPEDLKIALSYDFIRDVAQFEFMFLLGSDSARINFNKLTTHNIDEREAKRDFYKNAKRVKIIDPENI